METRLAATQKPQTILALSLSHPELATLSLKVVPGGGIVLVVARRGAVYHATVSLATEARADFLRITYSWDVPAARGRLAIEWPERRITRWAHTGPAVPIAASDIQRLGGFFDLKDAHPDLIFAALSDEIEPLGPMPSLAAGTPLMSVCGPLPVKDLRRGALLAATDGEDAQMVLSQVSRTVPAFGSFAPIRLRAPYFGLRRDIVVAPEQRLLIGGSEVEYTYGCEHVLVPARHLVNGTAAVWDACGPLAHYVHVVLPENAPVVAAGASLESLYIGRIRRHEDALAQSLLADVDKAFLPEHAPGPYRTLSPFEAITLAEMRAA